MRNTFLKFKHSDTQIGNSILFKKQVLIGFVKMIGLQNHLSIRFSIALKRNKMLKVRNPSPSTKINTKIVFIIFYYY